MSLAGVAMSDSTQQPMVHSVPTYIQQKRFQLVLAPKSSKPAYSSLSSSTQLLSARPAQAVVKNVHQQAPCPKHHVTPHMLHRGSTAGRKQHVAGNLQLITRPAKGSTNCTILYRRQRNKLERAGVKAAVGNGSLTWVNSQAHQLQAQVDAAIANAAAAAVQKRMRQQARQLEQQHGSKHTTPRRIRPSCKGHMSVRAQQMKRTGRKVIKLVQVGGQMYYATEKGLSSLQAVNARASAAQVKPAPVQASSIVRAPSLAPVRNKTQQLATTAVQRSLRNARARHRADKAAKSRGLCLFYCKHGHCELAKANQCEKVHDPSKVAVCPKWLAGKCRSKTCRLQHKVLPELMPVCSYFLQVIVNLLTVA
eukprot:jgi/Chrzof1/9305/UNPLg00273.t1